MKGNAFYIHTGRKFIVTITQSTLKNIFGTDGPTAASENYFCPKQSEDGTRM